MRTGRGSEPGSACSLRPPGIERGCGRFSHCNSRWRGDYRSMPRMRRRAFIRSSVVAGSGIAFLHHRVWSALEPATASLPFDVPITDAHAHFWDPALFDYSWLRNSPIGGPKLPADYWKAATGFKAERLVFVQAECRRDQARSEAAWVEKLAREEPRIAAIVAFAPVNDEKALALAL